MRSSSVPRDQPGAADKMTVTLKKVSLGTELNIVQEGLPEAIPLEAVISVGGGAAKLGEADRA